MTVVRTRAVGAVVAAAACAAVLSTTATFTSGVRALMAEVGLVSNDGWIMGGTGNPMPDTGYLSDVKSLYLSQYLAPNNDFSYSGLTTPEQFCPIVCNASQPDLTFGESLNKGVIALDGKIVPDLQGGNDVSVLGYSQSATVASIEMNNLINNTPDNVNLNDLNFTLLGDPNSPIGGILDRFQFPDGVGPGSLTQSLNTFRSWTFRSTWKPRRPAPSLPTSTPANTTAGPTSRRIPATCSPTSTP